MNIVKHFLLALPLSIFIALDSTAAECDKTQLYKKEIKNIESVSDGNLNELFLVSVFDGYIPIPSRFVAYAETDRDILLFDSSISYSKQHRYLGCPYAPEVIGHIEIGDIAKCDFCDNVVDAVARDVKIIFEEKTDDISIKILVSKNRLPGENELAVIYNNKNYLLISDDNKDLWRVILDAYRSLKLKK